MSLKDKGRVTLLDVGGATLYIPKGISTDSNFPVKKTSDVEIEIIPGKGFFVRPKK